MAKTGKLEEMNFSSICICLRNVRKYLRCGAARFGAVQMLSRYRCNVESLGTTEMVVMVRGKVYKAENIVQLEPS